MNPILPPTPQPPPLGRTHNRIPLLVASVWVQLIQLGMVRVLIFMVTIERVRSKLTSWFIVFTSMLFLSLPSRLAVEAGPGYPLCILHICPLTTDRQAGTSGMEAACHRRCGVPQHSLPWATYWWQPPTAHSWLPESTCSGYCADQHQWQL